MKSFLKALLPATFIPIAVCSLGIALNLILYTVPEFSAQFKNFFGVSVSKFNPITWLLIFISLTILFALIFKSDFKESE